MFFIHYNKFFILFKDIRVIHYLLAGLFFFSLECIAKRYLLVACSESDEICFVDLSNPKNDPEKVKVGVRPRNVVFGKFHNLAFSGNCYDSNLSVIEIDSKKVIATIPVGSFPWGMRLSPDGKKIYTCNLGDNTISVVDALSLKNIGTIPVGFMPWSIKVTPDQKNALVTCFKDNTVQVIDLQKNKVTQTLKVGKSPRSIKLNPEGDRAYVINFNSNDLSVLQRSQDGHWQVLEKNLPLGVHPMGMMISGDGKKAFIMHRGEEGVWVLELETMKVLQKKIFYDNHFSGIAFDNESQLLYLSRMSENSITVIDTKTMEIAGRMDIEYGPKGLAYFDTEKNTSSSVKTVSQALRSLTQGSK
jgi:YVTN family beta-propeller protein